MREWANKLLEDAFGKKALGLIAIFLAGAIAMAWASRMLVTTARLEAEVERLYVAIQEGDQRQELRLVAAKEQIFRDLQASLEREIEALGTSPALSLENRLDGIRREVEYLVSRQRTLADGLEEEFFVRARTEN